MKTIKLTAEQMVAIEAIKNLYNEMPYECLITNIVGNFEYLSDQGIYYHIVDNMPVICLNDDVDEKDDMHDLHVFACYLILHEKYGMSDDHMWEIVSMFIVDNDRFWSIYGNDEEYEYDEECMGSLKNSDDDAFEEYVDEETEELHNTYRLYGFIP